MPGDPHDERESEPNMPRLDVPDPPPNQSYGEAEDYLNRELLRVNGIGQSESELHAALAGPSNILQAAAAHTLGASGSAEAIEPLRALLDSADELVKVEAAYALARRGDDQGRAVLDVCLDVPLTFSVVAAIAAGYLARLGQPHGYARIREAFASEIVAVRMVACKQLYFFVPFHGQPDRSGQPIDVAQEFARALQDPDAGVQWQALYQLRELRLPMMRGALEQYIQAGAGAAYIDLARQIIAQLPGSQQPGAG